MAHFALVDNNIVIQVIVAEQNFIDSGALGNPDMWIQTSYNTSGGVHLLGGTPLRKNYAGVGYTYDRDLDAFIPPKPFNSWILDQETCLWKAPIDTPDSINIWLWDEESMSWVIDE